MQKKTAKLTIATIIGSIIVNIFLGLNVSAAGRECGLRATGNDILIDIVDKVLWADQTEAIASYELPANIPAGTYKVSLASYDNHSTKITNPEQYDERYFVIFKDVNGDEITRTDAISDLPEDEDNLHEVVNNSLEIDSDVKAIVMYHDAYPDALPQTIAPVCILLEPIEDDQPTNTPTPTPTPDDNNNNPTPTPTGTGSTTPTPTDTPDRGSGNQNRGSGSQNRNDDDDDDGSVRGTTTQSPTTTQAVSTTPTGSVQGLARTGINTAVPALVGMMNLSLLGTSVFILRRKVAGK